MRFVGINPGVNFVLLAEVKPHPWGERRRVSEEARSTIVNYERDGSRDFTWPWGVVFAPALEDGTAPRHPTNSSAGIPISGSAGGTDLHLYAAIRTIVKK
jgi:hypothetical protein